MTVRNLQHYALSVPDPEAGKQFYEDFGLEGRVDGNQVVMRCAGRDQDQVILTEGIKRKLHHICFGKTEDGLAAASRSTAAMTRAWSMLPTTPRGPVYGSRIGKIS